MKITSSSLPLGFENSPEDARSFIGPIFESIKENAGELAIIRSIESGAFVERTIYPEDSRSVLKNTQSSFDNEDSILDYYKINVGGLKVIVQRYSDLQSEGQPCLDNELNQRDLDATHISAFILDCYQRASALSKKLDCKIRVIDFGGGWGNAFYYSSSANLPFIDSWCVVDLPEVAKSGQFLLDQYCQNQWEHHDVISEKLRFCTSIKQAVAEKKRFSNTIDVYIMNGVYMHLENPLDIIEQMIEHTPFALMIGNNFEMGHNMFRFCKKLNKKEMIVGGNSNDMDHKFAVEHPFNITNTVLEASKAKSHPCQFLRVRKRDSLNLKLYHLQDWSTFFVDSEYNRNFYFHFQCNH